jgi:hypothetical protein
MDEENTTISRNGGQHTIQLHSTSYDLFILVLTIFALFVATGLLLPTRPSVEAILLWVDFIVCMIFLFDFFSSLWRGPKRADFFFRRGGWLDLLGSIPVVPGLSWTAVFRLARLNRAIRIRRRFRGEERLDVVVFALLNLGPVSIKGREITREGQHKAYIYIGLGVLLVTIPLAINGYRVARETYLEWQIIPIAEEWLRASDSDLKLDDVNVFGDEVEVVLNGSSDPLPWYQL